MRRKDWTGIRLYSLMAIEPYGLDAQGRVTWLFECDCGNHKVIVPSAITHGNTRSCGCYRRINNREIHKTHGYSKLPEYKVWGTMKQRCNNPKSPAYYLYGKRGIRVCEAWTNSFDAFYKDMGPRPTPQHSIDRIDNSGNYEPSNCRWATKSQQAYNRRRKAT